MPARPAASPPETPASGRTVLDSRDISRALTRIAHEILERNKGASDLVLLGIPTRGVPLARRIAEKITAVEGVDVAVGSLDVTMYRDDLRMRPTRTLLPTDIPSGGIDDKVVVLVDDVLFSGRTIRADFVGKNLPTSLVERVRLSVAEIDGQDAVTIEGTAGTAGGAA